MSSQRQESDLKWKMKKKLFKNKTGGHEKSWRRKKLENKEHKERKLLEQLRAVKEGLVEPDNNAHESEDLGRPFSISIAVPGSFLNVLPCAELRTIMAGMIGQAATLFRVEEVIVYDETARMTQEALDVYWNGYWFGDLNPSDSNLESNFLLARILEYLECPQYLRRAVFPKQKALQYAGLLNPLDSQHHLKINDLSVRFREGIILDKPVKAGRGQLVDIGLEKELQITEETHLPPGTRVTVEMNSPETDTGKRFRGALTNASVASAKSGLYWGYSVRIAKCLGEVMEHSKYDYIFATSSKGRSADELEISPLTKGRVLLVMGGVNGIEAALEADESYQNSGPLSGFDGLLCPLEDSGSRSMRLEQELLISLTSVRSRLCRVFDWQPAT